LSADFFQFHFPEKVVERPLTVFYIIGDNLNISPRKEVSRRRGIIFWYEVGSCKFLKE
jgi:hypothetical protein